jgi:protein involved in polysaccharide export with SLBB domain
MKYLVLIMMCLVVIGCQSKNDNPLAGFRIQGEIKNPGEYKLTESISYVQALGMAGGYTPDCDANNVTIKRGDTEIVKDMMIPKSTVGPSTAETFLIQAGDIIIVPKRKK